MIMATVALVFVLLFCMVPYDKIYQFHASYRNKVIVPVVVIACSLGFVYFKSLSYQVFPLFLLFFCFYRSLSLGLTKRRSFEWLFMVITFSLLGFLNVSHEYYFITSFIYVFHRKTRQHFSLLFLIYGTTVTFLIFNAGSTYLWDKFAVLLMIPLVVFLAFENEKERLSQANLLIMLNYFVKNTSEFMPNYFFILGLFLVLIALIRSSSSYTRWLLLGFGSYLSFFSDLDSLLVMPIIFMLQELSFFKGLLLTEVKKVVLDGESFSIGYNQVIILSLLSFIFSGLPFSPFSLLYGLSPLASLLVFLLFIDFFSLSLGAVSDDIVKSELKQNVTRLLVFISCIIPLSINQEKSFFFYQLLTLTITVTLYFYLRKNPRLDSILKEMPLRYKSSIEMLPIEGNEEKVLQYIKSKDQESFLLMPTFSGVSTTLVYSLYLFITVFIIYWMAT